MNELEAEGNEIKEGGYVYKISDFGVIPVRIKQVSNYGWIKLENNAQIYPRKSKTYCLTREKAEETIKYRGKIAKKKELMYEYECKLNKEMGLNDFLVNY